MKEWISNLFQGIWSQRDSGVLVDSYTTLNVRCGSAWKEIYISAFLQNAHSYWIYECLLNLIICIDWRSFVVYIITITDSKKIKLNNID